MKKLLTLFTCCISMITLAQIPNSGMESWGSTIGQPPEPMSYVSGNVLVNSILAGNTTSVIKVSGAEAYSGSYAAKITTVKVNSNPSSQYVPDTIGVLFLGKAQIIPQFSLKRGAPYGLRSDSLTFYYKYQPVGSDNGAVAAFLTKWNGLTKDTIATAFFPITTATSTYTLGTIKFNYNPNFSTTTNPDTLQLFFLSSVKPWINHPSTPNYPKIGSSLWIDEAAIIGLNEKLDIMSFVNIYPNPASEFIHFHSENQNVKHVEIFDLNGKLIAKEEFKNKTILFSTENLTNGYYIYRIKNIDNSVLSDGKIEICK